MNSKVQIHQTTACFGTITLNHDIQQTLIKKTQNGLNSISFNQHNLWITPFSSPEPMILLACGRNRELWEQPFQTRAIDRGFIKGRALRKLTGCEQTLAINLPGCFRLLFLLSFIRKTKIARLKNPTDLLHKN